MNARRTPSRNGRGRCLVPLSRPPSLKATADRPPCGSARRSLRREMNARPMLSRMGEAGALIPLGRAARPLTGARLELRFDAHGARRPRLPRFTRHLSRDQDVTRDAIPHSIDASNDLRTARAATVGVRPLRATVPLVQPTPWCSPRRHLPQRIAPTSRHATPTAGVGTRTQGVRGRRSASYGCQTR